MKTLARHIDLLLRENDCVILPGFGGFIAHTVPAYYVSEEHLYYPPSRSISFNSAITMNDGLLAQSYMKSYQVDYARATYMIDVAVDNLRDELDEKGEVELPRIGVIKQDVYQALQFVPEASGIASPKNFGLGSFFMKELCQLQESTAKSVATPTKSIITQTAKTFDVHISKSMLKQVMSTAAVLLLLLMVSLPVGNHKPTDIAALHLVNVANAQKEQVAPLAAEQASAPMIEINTQMCSVAPEDEPVLTIQEAELPAQEEAVAPVVEAPVAETTEATAVVETPVEMPVETPVETLVETPVAEPIVEQPMQVEHVQVPAKTYHIIVASLPSLRGADEVVSKYASQGYTDVTLVERDDRVRISLVQFTDKDEANAYLKTLREKEAFQNAWLLAVRN